MGGQGECLAQLGWAEEHQHAPVQALSVSWNELLPCLCKQPEHGGAVCCQSCEHTSLQLVQGGDRVAPQKDWGPSGQWATQACMYIFIWC